MGVPAFQRTPLAASSIRGQAGLRGRQGIGKKPGPPPR